VVNKSESNETVVNKSENSEASSQNDLLYLLRLEYIRSKQYIIDYANLNYDSVNLRLMRELMSNSKKLQKSCKAIYCLPNDDIKNILTSSENSLELFIKHYKIRFDKDYSNFKKTVIKIYVDDDDDSLTIDISLEWE